MKPLALNLSKMKKVAGDDSSSTFLHPDGHHMVIAHHAVSTLQRKQLEKMPVHNFAEGGGVVDKSGDIHPYDAITSALHQGGSQEAYDQSMASLPKTPVDESAPVPDANPTQSAPMQSARAVTQPVDASAGQSQAPYNPGISAVPSSALDNQEKTIRNAMGAEQAAAKNIANTWKDYTAQSSKITPVEDIIKKRDKADDDFQKQVIANKINPDRYWQNASTGKKIASAIGLIFGGLGQGLIGGSNPAQDNINKAIDEDIDAQKNDQSKTMNLWKMNREATQNDIQANILTRNQLLGATEAKIKMFQAQSGSAEAALRFAPMLLALAKEKSDNNLKLALSQPASKTGLINTDPASFVQRLVPPAHQQKVFDEIDAAKNTAMSAKEIMNEFDKAADTVNAVDFVPGMENRHQKALHALMGPTFKDIEGTVRQAAMDNMAHNTTPQFGDRAETKATKRNALDHYLKSKMAASTALGSGIDLSRFSATAHPDVSLKQEPIKMQDKKTGKIWLADPATKKFVGWAQ